MSKSWLRASLPNSGFQGQGLGLRITGVRDEASGVSSGLWRV